MRKILAALIVILCASCSHTIQNVAYLQNQQIDSKFEYRRGGDIRLKPGDEISIYVTSKNPELAIIFNLNEQLKEMSSSSSGNTLGYTVDSCGEIDFPVLGKLHIEGMTREALSSYIKEQLITKRLINDPVVIVGFNNLEFSILGDVSSPGVYSIKRDRTTILDAIAMAGDLQITAQRGRLFLTREEGCDKITYQLDLKSTEIYKSPAYFIQQNDMIYAEPNEVKSNQSTVNGNTIRSVSFWMSLSSLIMTIVVLIAN